nr:unnamed protein product [Callosobruchus chinensis]
MAKIVPIISRRRRDNRYCQKKKQTIALWRCATTRSGI